jgi:hypothetical protein
MAGLTRLYTEIKEGKPFDATSSIAGGDYSAEAGKLIFGEPFDATSSIAGGDYSAQDGKLIFGEPSDFLKRANAIDWDDIQSVDATTPIVASSGGGLPSSSKDAIPDIIVEFLQTPMKDDDRNCISMHLAKGKDDILQEKLDSLLNIYKTDIKNTEAQEKWMASIMSHIAK